MKKQEFISSFEHKVVFGKDSITTTNVLELKNTIKYLVQHTPNDAELGAKIRMLINNTYGK